MVGVVFDSKASPNHCSDTATGPLVRPQVRRAWALLEDVEEMLVLFGRQAWWAACMGFGLQRIFSTLLECILPSFDGGWSRADGPGDFANAPAFRQHAGSPAASGL